jgi:hypothetical protein
MDQRNDRLRKTLAKRRDHGIRKAYNGRVKTTRFDASPPTLIEIHQRPIRLWVDDEADACRGGGVDDGAISLAYKPSSNKDRTELTFDSPYSFVDEAQGEYIVTFLRLDVPKRKPRRVVCTVQKRMDDGTMRQCTIESLSA